MNEVSERKSTIRAKLRIYIYIYIYIYMNACYHIFLLLHTYISIHAGYILTQWIIDARNDKDAGRLLYQYLPLTIFVRVQKGYSRFVCERELETEQKLQYSDPIVMTVNIVSFLFSWCWGPLCWVLAFFTASYHLLWTPTHQGPKPLQPGCNSTGTWLPSWLHYIIIQCLIECLIVIKRK